jgi:carboxypeptidase C (cathepsin A)
MKKIVLLSTALLLSVPAAHAGFMDALGAAAQLAGAVQGNNSNLNASAQANVNAQINTAPLDSYELENMDCAALELTALRSKRELEQAKANLKNLDEAAKDPQYQQQKATNATIGAIGSLFANKGGNTGQYGQIAQQMGANSNALEQEMDTQLALGKKYMSDLESIAVYQKHKKCK